MESFVGQMQEGYTINNIINVLTKATGWRQRGFSLLTVALVLIVKHYMSNTELFINPIIRGFGSIIRNSLYTTKILPICGPDKVEHFIAKIIQSKEDEGFYVNGFPVYWNIVGDNTCVEMMRGVHYSWYREITEQGTREFMEKNKNVVLGSICKKFNNNYTTATYSPMMLFPSSNYKALEKSVDRYLRVVKLTKNYTPLGILINGEPGLGKTKSSDYLAYKEIFKEVIKIDMTLFLENNFEEVFKKCYHGLSISCPTLFVVDEMDKYLPYYIEKSYQKKKESLLQPEEKEKNDKPKTPNISSLPTKEEYTKSCKTDFLYALLRILERDGLSQPCVILFCCNNFNTIFEGVDAIHIDSLKSRFVPITFYRCDALELVEYLSYFNNLLKGTEMYREKEQFDSLTKLINPDISLPYRSLTHLSILADYDLLKIVKAVNNWRDGQSPRPIEEELIIPQKPAESDKEKKSIDNGDESDNDEDESNNEDNNDDESDNEEESNNKENVISPIKREEESNNKEKVISPINQDLKVKIVAKITDILTKFKTKRTKTEKTSLFGEMYDYISEDEVLDLLEAYPKLYTTVKDKYSESISDHLVGTVCSSAIEKIKRRFPDFC